MAKKDIRIQVREETLRKCKRIYKKHTKTDGFVSNSTAINYVLNNLKDIESE